MRLRRAALLASLVLVCAWPASAQSVSVQFQDGYVTLKAQNAPLRAILAEWSRVGGSRIVNADRITGTPTMTLELSGVTERQALGVLLRSVSGYIAAPRRDASPGASTLDRILILPTSNPVTQASSSPTPAGRTASPVFVQGGGGNDATALVIGSDGLTRNLQQVQEQLREATARAVVARERDAEDDGGDDVEEVAPAQQRLPPRRNAPASSNPFGNIRGTSRPGEVVPAPQQ